MTKGISRETLDQLGGYEGAEIESVASRSPTPPPPPKEWPDWMKNFWAEAWKEFPQGDDRSVMGGGLLPDNQQKGMLAPWDRSPDEDQLVLRKDTPWVDAEQDENTTKFNRERVFTKTLANKFREEFRKKYGRDLIGNENYFLHHKLKKMMDKFHGNTDDQLYDLELTDPAQDPSRFYYTRRS